MLGGRSRSPPTVGEGSVFTLLAARRAGQHRRRRRAPRAGSLPGGRTVAGAARPRRCAAPPRASAPAGAALAGATVLIVDDDVRNVFALTSALELHGLTVLYADNGATGIRLAHRAPRGRRRADGHDDARPRRQRDHAADPRAARRPGAAGGVPHREGHARRPGGEPRRGRHRVRHEARRPRRAAGPHGHLGHAAAPSPPGGADDAAVPACSRSTTGGRTCWRCRPSWRGSRSRSCPSPAGRTRSSGCSPRTTR